MAMATQQIQKDTQDAVERTAATVDRAADVGAARAHDMTDAFRTSYGVFADGIQEIQQAYWQIVQQSFDVAATAPSELMRCKTMSDVAEIQRGIIQRCLDGIVDANRT